MLVETFFVFCTLSTFFSGMLLPRFNLTAATKSISRGLMLTGVAFAIWSAAAIMKPSGASLDVWISAGATVFIVALVFYLAAAVSRSSNSTKKILIALGILYAIALWFVRLALPSHPGFSQDGLFFFQPDDVVKFMYLIVMTAVIIPAIQMASEDIKAKDSSTAIVVHGALVANLVGGILLLVSVMNVKDTLMYLVGWGMGIAQLVLLLACLGVFKRRSAAIA